MKTTETVQNKSQKTMRAVIQREYGDADVLTVGDLAHPQPKADEVLIEVHAAGVDRGVWHLMTGLPYLIRLMGFGLTKPKNPVPGLDVAGRVVAVGADVTRFSVGAEVFGIAAGSYAEYAVAKQDKLAHKPTNVTFEQAGVAAISGITALQALTDVADVQAGSSVLVIGASGGVGSYVVQLAKALGAQVTGVASGAKGDLVKSLGANKVIDYAKTDFLDGSTHYDVIIDTGGRYPVQRVRKALGRNGTLVIVGGEDGGRLTGGIGRQIGASLLSVFVPQSLRMFMSKEHFSHMERLAEFMEHGAVTPAIGRRYPLDNARQAVADLAAGRASGKSVIVVRDGE